MFGLFGCFGLKYIFYTLDGFRKISNIEHGGLKLDADDVEFFHQNFVQEQEEQLQHIKRKVRLFIYF